jgi:exonuclease SbcC
VRIDRLTLENFRQHARADVTFHEGVTAIIGPNGAGKTSLVEAIGWAIYGAAAARGTNETIRYADAGAGSRVRAELWFRLGLQRYRVRRSLSSADVWVDDGSDPAASGVGGVTEYLERRLGMSREEFFNTYYTGQRDLHFLARFGPTERARFLNQVLGYDRLRVAQDLARSRRSELRHEATGLAAALPSRTALEAERDQAAGRVEQAVAAVAAAESGERRASAALAQAAPRRAALETAREEHARLGAAAERHRAEADASERAAARAAEEVRRAEKAGDELAGLSPRLEGLEAAEGAVRGFQDEARRHERRRALAEARADVARDLQARLSRLEGLERAPALLAECERELEGATRAHAAAVEAEAAEREAWGQRRQEVDAALGVYHREYKDLGRRIESLREAGPESPCPTCGRPLGAGFAEALAALEDERFRLMQDGKHYRQRAEQLAEEPEPLIALVAARDAAAANLERLRARHEKCAVGVRDLERERAEVAALRERIGRADEDIAALPEAFDPLALARAEAAVDELRAVARRVSALELAIAERDRWEAEGREAADAAAAAREAHAAALAGRAELGFEEAAYEDALREHERTEAEARAAEIALSEARAEERAARERLAAAERALAEDATRRTRLEALQKERRLHEELDRVFSDLRSELNARVRPELGALAGDFLALVTDGRYAAVEVDETYDVQILDDGRPKPVISGGEEDVANLVLRLAVSQMIAERAGQPLSVLILDEVFGSLDRQRRAGVLDLLQRLRARFDQVLLITHVEDIREGVDQVLRVGYDERTGGSVISAESPSPLRPPRPVEALNG